MIGIYFLLKRKKVVYIGQSTNIVSRIKCHSNKEFDSFRVICCKKSKLHGYEKRWIVRFKPKYNICLNPNYTSDKMPKSVYLPKSLWDKIAKMAAPYKQSISNVIEILVEKA